MKAIFISQQLEFKIEVPREEIFQGDLIDCIFTVKNHVAAAQTVDQLYLELAVGNQKKIKAKTPDAFQILAAEKVALAGDLAAGQSLSGRFNFNLDKNCLITDKSESLYLLFGSRAMTAANGNLLLTVRPFAVITSILELMESSFQFVRKGEKSSDGFVAAKLKPPATPKFAQLEYLVMNFKFEGDELLIKYNFKVKKFVSVNESKTGLKTAKVDLEHKLSANEYLLNGGFFNIPKVEKRIGEILADSLICSADYRR